MRRQDENWRLPELDRLGAQLRAEETAQRSQRARSLRRVLGPWRYRVILAMAAVAAAAAGLLEIVVPAGARSPVNRAPAAAERSGSVRFDSAQEISVDKQLVTSVRETGRLDFTTGDFATSLAVGEGAGRIERRRTGDMIYFRRTGAKSTSGRNIGWSAVRVSASNRRAFSVPGGYTLIDPQVVFRVMSDARSAVTLVQHEQRNGVATTHFRLATSLSDFRQAADASPRTATDSIGAAARLDVWLDGRGRPVTVEANFQGPGRRRNVKMRTVTNFRGYGEPVVVRAPPRSVISQTRPDPSEYLLADPAAEIERVLFGER